jgi:hypothetical protein
MFTSLLLPFTLPAPVGWLMGGEMKISAVDMSLMLLKAIFIPLGPALLPLFLMLLPLHMSSRSIFS